MIRPICRILATCTLLTGFAGGASALDGECLDTLQDYFYTDSGGAVRFDDSAASVLVAELETPVYRSETGNDATGRTLEFGAKLGVLYPGDTGTRIQVGDLNSRQEIGWVESEAVLCRKLPLFDPVTGLSRRAFVRTLSNELGQDAIPRKAFESSDGRCKGGEANCQEISKFAWYFIFGERDGRLLISRQVNLEKPGAELFGWLDTEFSIPWNVASALRPAEELASRPGPNGEEEDYICAYPSLDLIGQEAECRKILGGKSWFQSDQRLPVIDQSDQAWKIAFAGAGGTENEAELTARILGGTQTTLETFNSVDLFFVIDGTKSVAPAIAAIKGGGGNPGIVERLSRQLRAKLADGAEFRVGFRVYRDSAPKGKDGDGVSEMEYYPLPNDCSFDPEAFDIIFGQVEAGDRYQDDDFSENVFGGIEQAARDAKGCEDRLKIFVVIGDHGYDPAKQTARDKRAVDVPALTGRLKGGEGEAFRVRPVLTFIQLPAVTPLEIQQQNYDNAYRSFERQAREMLATHFAGEAPAEIDGLFTSLDSNNVTEQVAERIVSVLEGYLNPDVTSEVQRRVNAGESVVEAIRKVQEQSQGRNIPILYFDMIRDSLCQQAPEQCEERVMETVGELYIPKTYEGDVVPEVMMSNEQLSDWRTIARTIRDVPGTGIRSRQQFVDVLIQRLSDGVGLDLSDAQSRVHAGRNVTIGEALQMNRSLPFGFESPMLNYSIAELTNPNLVPACEFNYIAFVAEQKASLLEQLVVGTNLPNVVLERPNNPQCPQSVMTPMGREVLALTEIVPLDLNVGSNVEPPPYRIDFQEDRGTRFYWIPVKYLP